MLFHNPVIPARIFAALDVLSKGRAIAGFDMGWSKDEYQVSIIYHLKTEEKGQTSISKY
jgi:alkanesulfonate monooxygenase SsuD/methylene tetrahydromethanopterin reductase-like flavin-dependent oxidoreductase (luciferase family)